LRAKEATAAISGARWPRRTASGAAGALLDDPLHVVDEAHVEHPVDLVEDEDLDAAQP
jgi:hypothetical protein